MKLPKLFKLKNLVENSGNYIGSVKTKEELLKFYRNSWLPISEDFKNKFGIERFSKIEENAAELYKLAKTTRPSKDKVLVLLSEIEEIIDQIEIEMIRKHGSVIEVNAKEEIKNLLQTLGFTDTLSYIKKAETEFSGGNNKECCIQSRLAIEEFFRNLREKHVGNPIPRGTLGDHVDYLEKRLHIMRHSERCLIQNGFYSFLSEKGNHATADVPTLDDAKISLYILYVLLEYCLEKYI